MRKCVGLAEERTISSGIPAQERASWKASVALIALSGSFIMGQACFAQKFTVEHQKVESSKSTKSAVAESQSSSMTVLKPQKSPEKNDGKSVVVARATADGKVSAALKKSIDGKAAQPAKGAPENKPDSATKLKTSTASVPAAAGAAPPSAAIKTSTASKSVGDTKKIEGEKDKHSTSVRKATRPASLLVPPPPPDTPTMIPNFGALNDSNGLMPMEYMSPELLKKRKEDLVAQLADAKSEAKKRQDEAQSIKEKGEQFKTLFDEGVISKRELDAAQKDASDVDSSINRAKLRVSELQTLLDGVSGRINQINKREAKATPKTVSIRVTSSKHRKTQ